MIDLHAHTNLSDGSLEPAQLVEEAVRADLEALGVCDHDTLAGYDAAVPIARSAGLELVCGIELSTRMPAAEKPRGKSVHLLGYFLGGSVPADFRSWLTGIQEGRRDRNRRLAAKLQSLGLDVTVEEAEAIGRNLTGRPHFARILLNKGYVASIQEAFDVYLDESARGYVDRCEPSLVEGIQRIRAAGGLPVLAHPVRLLRKNSASLDAMVERLTDDGLGGIEVWHSDHEPKDVEYLSGLSQRFGLAQTGGSDFHGDAKPGVKLGTGLNGNLAIPREVLDRLRR